MAIDQNPEKSLFDALYCEEEQWASDVEQDDDNNKNNINNLSVLPLLLLEKDLLWDDEELQSLFSKERETCLKTDKEKTSLSLSSAARRKEAVEWILKINARYGFSPLTAILAVNYLDRFMGFSSNEKPIWMMQLSAVTCLSLAAKVEETHVPLLLDLQVEGAKYVFEAKTIQRMEILVLTSLKWRMNPVTPLSFVDHVIRRLGLKSNLHWEFLRSSENLLLSFVSDPRFMLYLPSVLATATMLHVIHHQVEPNCNDEAIVDYENQLLSVLKISKEEVGDCYEAISDVLSKTGFGYCNNVNYNPLKRKICQVDDQSYNSSIESWGSSSLDESVSCISSSSPDHQITVNIFKKRRVIINYDQEQQMMRLPSNLSRSVFMDAAVIASPH